jgi:hypothetical protein
MPDNQLFSSAHAAMKFAFNFQGLPSLSVMNRMGQEPSGMPGKGLSGLDGAAQAGIVRYKVSTLGMLHEAILIADIAPRSQPCPCRSACCSGQARNQEWSDAINWLCDNVRVEALDGHNTDHKLRRVAVESFFGAKHTATKIAGDLKKDRSTIGVVIGKVKNYLLKEQVKAFNGADDVLDCLVIKE